MENAVEYTPAGGLVELSLSRSESEVLMAVRDTGIGIDPADAARIFEPFLRLDDPPGKRGARGWASPSPRSIALAHGGANTLESAPKAGRLFTVHLPAA